MNMAIPSSKPKGLLVDNLGNCALLIAALLYFCLFFGAVGGGASGPQIFSQASNPTAVLRQNCVDLGSCQAVWFGTLTDMSPQHQFMWLSMNMERPTAASGSPALANSPVSWGLVYQVDIVAIGADGTRILMAQNQTHAQTISFRSDGASSSDVLLFYTQEIRYSTYQLTVRFMNSLGPFSFVPLSTGTPNVNMAFTMTFVNKAYTQFELGWKMFFVTTSVLLFLFYTGLLFCGPGTRDEESEEPLSSTVEQLYIWWLGLFLIWFNDPLFQVEIDNPSIVTAGLLAFCTVSFLAALLMFWLVSFDLARLQGEGGVAWQLTAKRSSELGICFWLPKVILMTVFWTLSLAGYMYIQYTQLSDPSFNIWGDVNSWPIARWFYVFVSCLLGAYMIYLFSLIVLSFRHFPTLRPAARLTTTLTLCTIIVMLVGLYMNVFTPFRSSSAAFVSVYAAANLYVWWLMLAFVPGPRLPEWFIEMVSDDKNAAARAAMASRHVDTRLGGGKKNYGEDESEGEEEEEGDGSWADRRDFRGARNRRTGGGLSSDFSVGIDDEEEDEMEEEGRRGYGSQQQQRRGGGDATANAIAHAAASAAVAAMRAYTGSLSQLPQRTARRSSGGGSRLSAPSTKPPPRRQPQPPSKQAASEETIPDNIVSFLGPDGKEALRAAAYRTEADVGEDGHAFVLSPEGLQVFLDEAASQQSLSAPGQTMETHTGGSEGGEDTVVRAVVEREGKPASKVRFAEPPTEDGEEDTVSREEGVGGEAGKGNPF